MTRHQGNPVLALLIGAVLAGCSVPVAYQPNEGVLDGMSRDQREQLFAETLSRARKPPIYQVWIDDSSYGYDSAVAVRGDLGIPVGYTGRRRIVYFANVSDLRLFDNNAVFVFDTSGRVVDKIRFGYRDDAAQMIDLIASYRAQRYSGEPSPGPRRPQGRRYDRRYEPRAERPYDDRPPDDYYDDYRDYDPRYDYGPRY